MSKKTEKVEVRMSPELKARLSAHGENTNEAVSQIIRRAVEREITLNLETSAGATTMSPNLKFASPSFLVGVAAVSLSAMLIAGSLQPATAEAGVRMAFADLDHNQDGVIDRTEFDMGVIVSMEAIVEDMSFASLKTGVGCDSASENHGLVGPQVDETRQIQEAKALLDEEFSKTDKNNDAQISFDEFRKTQRAEMTKSFHSLDHDKDGRLSQTEYVGGLYVEAGDFLNDVCLQSIEGKPNSLIKTVEPREYASTEQEIARAQRVEFAAADENLDGVISLEEFLKR